MLKSCSGLLGKIKLLAQFSPKTLNAHCSSWSCSDAIDRVGFSQGDLSQSLKLCDLRAQRMRIIVSSACYR
jgi:hypothetical protein